MSLRLFLQSLAIAALSFLWPSGANADDIFTFELSGATYTWELPASPTIGPGDASDGGFAIQNVPYSVDGVASTFFPDEFGFSTTTNGGGFALFNTLDPSFPLHVAIDEFGPQFFAGSTSAPTFLPGTYMLTSNKNGPGTLIITSTPEPGSLLLIGSSVLTFLAFARKKFLT